MIAEIHVVQRICRAQLPRGNVIEEFMQMGEMIQIEWINFGGELQAAQGFRIHAHPVEEFTER